MSRYLSENTLTAYYRCLQTFQFADAALVLKASLVDPVLASALGFALSPLLLFTAAEREYYAMRFGSAPQSLYDVYERVLVELRQIELILKTAITYPTSWSEKREATKLIEALTPISVMCRMRKMLLSVYSELATAPLLDYEELTQICGAVLSIGKRELTSPLTSTLRDLLFHETLALYSMLRSAILCVRAPEQDGLLALYSSKTELRLLLEMAPRNSLPLFTFLQHLLALTTNKFSLFCAVYLNAPLPFNTVHSSLQCPPPPGVACRPSSPPTSAPPTVVHRPHLTDIIRDVKVAGFHYLSFVNLSFFPYKSPLNPEHLWALAQLSREGVISRLPSKHEQNIVAILKMHEISFSRGNTHPQFKNVSGCVYGAILVEKTICAVVVFDEALADASVSAQPDSATATEEEQRGVMNTFLVTLAAQLRTIVPA